MGKLFAIVNQKGGVGKTTTAVNLSAALHELGLKTLLCDFDPQANATSGLGIEKRQIKRSIYDVILNGVPVRDAIVHTDFGDVLPSSSDLAGAAVELIGAERREYILKDALASVKDEYDVIFIDCPPSLEMLTLNGLCAAEAIVVPVQCEYFALEGLSDLMGPLRMTGPIGYQTGAVALLGLPEWKGKTAYFVGIDKARFKQKVLPGDVLMLETKIVKLKGPIGIGEAVASVDGKVVAKAELSFAIGE